MIESLRLQNFKGHRDTLVEFGRLTVLVGPNGSGKTTVLQALQAMSLLVTQGPADVFKNEREPEFLATRGAQGPIKVELQGRQGAPWHLGVELELKPRNMDGKVPWSLKAAGEMPDRRGFHWMGSAFREFNESTLWPWLNNTTVFRFDAKKIAAPGYSEDPRGHVEPDGKNTAAALAALKLGNDEAFEAITKGLQSFVPAVERIRIKHARVIVDRIQSHTPHQSVIAHNEVSGHRIVFDFKNAPELPADAASEGTLVLLALLTALHANGPSGLVLIDDIEHSLHPTAQIELMKHLRGLLEQMPELQIVATTHSPYILDGVDPSNVRVFFPRPDGSIVTKKLSDHPDAERMKGILGSGEFWSAESEAWVLGEEAKA